MKTWRYRQKIRFLQQTKTESQHMAIIDIRDPINLVDFIDKDAPKLPSERLQLQIAVQFRDEVVTRSKRIMKK